MAESNSSLNISRLSNNILLPVITPSGEVSLKQLRSTILGHLSQSLGLTTPAIIKCLKTDPQGNNAEDSLCYESYRERCWHLLQQLTPLTPDSPLQVFGSNLTYTYLPLLIRGASKNQVLYLASPIADYLKSLFSTPEELLAYGKCIVNEQAYGLYELTVNISIQPDTNDELYQDGIGYISTNLLQLMNVGDIIQMRAVISPAVTHINTNTSPLSQLSQPLLVSQPAIAKGLLKSNPNLPQNSIVFTSSQFKGKKSDWTGERKLLLVVMANIDKPRKVKDSWTSLEINRDIRDNNAHLLQAAEKARSYCKIITSAISYGEYTKLFEESTCDHSKNIDSEDLSSSSVHHSMLQYAVKIAAGSTNPNLPPLEQHPYLALGMRDLLASKLRELAVDGPVRWDYLVNTGTLLKDHPRSIHTNLFPIGTYLVCRRYPILLSDSWGIVTAPSDTNQEIRLGSLIAQELTTDHDGDMIGLLECPLRLKATQKARQDMKQSVSKQHQRLSSTWWELPEVLVKNIGSSGVGTCTYGMLASKIAGQHEYAEELALELQKAVDSSKWSVKADVKKCREALDEYGLPSHVAHRHVKKQFKSPASTDKFDSPLWNTVADTYKSSMAKQEILPLRAFSGIFGYHAHSCQPQDFKELNTVYRWYCSHVGKISTLSSENDKDEQMKDLFSTLRAWARDKSDDVICAAWILCHGQVSKNNRASFVFEVFRERLMVLLIKAYQAQGIVKNYAEDETILQDTTPINRQAIGEPSMLRYIIPGIYGPLFTTGKLLEVSQNITIAYDKSEIKQLITVVIVQLKDITPEHLASLISQQKTIIIPMLNKPLPVLKTHTHGIFYNGKLVAEIADSSTPNIQYNPKLEGEIITYNKSLKVVKAV